MRDTLNYQPRRSTTSSKLTTTANHDFIFPILQKCLVFSGLLQTFLIYFGLTTSSILIKMVAISSTATFGGHMSDQCEKYPWIKPKYTAFILMFHHCVTYICTTTISICPC